MQSSSDSPFAPIEASVRAQDGAAASGFLLLDSNQNGLTWRLALIDTAKNSLDLQYYVWCGDASGVLVMKRVVEAANRHDCRQSGRHRGRVSTAATSTSV